MEPVVGGAMPRGDTAALAGSKTEMRGVVKVNQSINQPTAGSVVDWSCLVVDGGGGGRSNGESPGKRQRKMNDRVVIGDRQRVPLASYKPVGICKYRSRRS
jgi:hypothetical protein